MPSGSTTQRPVPLYTEEQRQRRDSSPWTMVQAVLAPLQFLIFLVSLWLVLRFLATGASEAAANLSILCKTVALMTIMVTGSLWERDVFGRYLFAPAFYWEDVFSMAVIALHATYIVMLFAGLGSADQRMLVALAGYAAYVVNAGQFLLKLRTARLQAPPDLAIAG